MITDKMMPEWGRAGSSEEGGGEREREREGEGETRLNFKPQRAKLQTSNSKLQTPIVLLKTPNPKLQTIPYLGALHYATIYRRSYPTKNIIRPFT